MERVLTLISAGQKEEENTNEPACTEINGWSGGGVVELLIAVLKGDDVEMRAQVATMSLQL